METKTYEVVIEESVTYRHTVLAASEVGAKNYARAEHNDGGAAKAAAKEGVTSVEVVNVGEVES